MWWELRTPAPMFDFRLLRIRSFTAANSAMFFIGAAMGGAMFLLILFLVNVLGYSELKAAIAITPMPLTGLIVAPNVGRLVDRIGPRMPASSARCFFFVGLVLLAQLGGESTALGRRRGASSSSAPASASRCRPCRPRPWARCRRRSRASARARSTPCGRSASPWAWRSSWRIFSGTIADNVVNASREAAKVVQDDPALPTEAKKAITADLAATAAAAKAGEGNPRLTSQDPLGNAPAAPPGNASGGSSR